MLRVRKQYGYEMLVWSYSSSDCDSSSPWKLCARASLILSGAEFKLKAVKRDEA